MPTTATQYGSYNPAATDPYPIETELAKLATGGNPANAANMLDTYQMQRMTDAGNYGHELAVQHDFARQQLAQQLQEQYMKYGQEALKTPGGLTLLRSQGGQAALGPDFGPPQINYLETSLGNARDAKTANEAGSAAKHGVDAGFPPNLDRLRGLSGGLFDTAGVPLALQTAAIRAAGHGDGGTGTGLKLNVQLPNDPNRPGFVFSGAKPKNMTMDQYIAEAKRQGIYTGPESVPSPGGGVTAPPARTSLQPKPQSKAPSTGGGRVESAGAGAAKLQQAANAHAANVIRSRDENAYKDIMAGAKGGNVQVYRGEDNRYRLRGASGKDYD